MKEHIKSNIKINDLLVGEQTEMNNSAIAWGILYRVKQEYLMSFIKKMESDPGTQTRITLPLFKMILFFAEHLQEHTRNDPELMKAIREDRARQEMQDMFGPDDVF